MRTALVLLALATFASPARAAGHDLAGRVSTADPGRG